MTETLAAFAYLVASVFAAAAAVALVLASDGDPRLAGLRGRLEGEIDAIGAGTLSWDRLGEKLEFPVTLNGSPAKA